jgi:hypothetical protein
MGAMTILFLAVTEANPIGWKRACFRFGSIKILQSSDYLPGPSLSPLNSAANF